MAQPGCLVRFTPLSDRCIRVVQTVLWMALLFCNQGCFAVIALCILIVLPVWLSLGFRLLNDRLVGEAFRVEVAVTSLGR